MIPAARPFEVVMFEAATKGDFRSPRQAARDLARVVELGHPGALLFIGIGGYEDDERELWDVPFVFEWLRRFIRYASPMLPRDWKERLLPECRALILLAAGDIERHQIKILPEWPGRV